jgi:hypothetical protein
MNRDIIGEVIEEYRIPKYILQYTSVGKNICRSLEEYSSRILKSIVEVCLSVVNIVAYLPHTRKVEPQNQPFLNNTRTNNGTAGGYAIRF